MGNAKIPDLYAVLGIANQNASQQEIQVSEVTYDKLSLKFHPDRRVASIQYDTVELIKVP